MQDYPVLYVDDEAPNLDVFEAVFGDAFVVHLANSGEEALALLDTERIAIVVADNRMPHMSGIELFRIIGERFPVVRRVLCTAYSDQRTAIDAINTAGVQHYLVKPWDADEVETLLRSLIARAHLEQSAQTLKASLIERERLAALDGMRGRITHDLGNVVSVLHAVDFDLQQTLREHTAHLGPSLKADLMDQASLISQASRSLAKLHKDSRATHRSTTTLQAQEHSAAVIIDGAARMVWHELLGAARLDYQADKEIFFWADDVGVSRILVAAIGWAADRVKRLGLQPAVVQLRVQAAGDVVHFDVMHRAEEDVPKLRALLNEGLEVRVGGEDRQFMLTLAVARDLAMAMSGSLEVLSVSGGACLRLVVPRSI